jgi:hypothetical protein
MSFGLGQDIVCFVRFCFSDEATSSGGAAYGGWLAQK